MDRARRLESAQRAYDIQVRAGSEGAAKFTFIGLGLAIIGHHTWPFFKKQTLAFKGFLVTGFTIFGLVTYAEAALQALEREERVRETAIRKEARLDLSRRGMVPTETAIALWREARQREVAEAAAADAGRSAGAPQ
ncbi:hypothetical protein PHLGIDRAFT_61047 [Phlebiopsis gigantea 11061_1 CR5-6]|uniref:HIG1 domain-containing protein n=1 Tax=Phlebiopsis gigantea (strain 11061_1 CR5-6) TaxID=745531 RepID=A0A0C3SEK5_PHLG1|nr:hypothetical protein PHLGIDRAFT_61047 [Phlebiopsis gigantea 11061_1 CR5-6]